MVRCVGPSGAAAVPGRRSRKLLWPSGLRKPENTTVRAGMFTPMANVSVANRTLTRPRLKSISTICAGKRAQNRLPKPVSFPADARARLGRHNNDDAPP